MTRNIKHRVYQHKHGLIPVFTSKYKIDRLLYFEDTNDVKIAIAREKQIKAWRGEKKIELIKSINPEWRDLSVDWIED